MSNTYTKEFAEIFEDCAEKAHFASSMSDRLHDVEKSIKKIHTEYVKFSKPNIHELNPEYIQLCIHGYAEQVVTYTKVLNEQLKHFDENFKDKRAADYANN